MYLEKSIILSALLLSTAASLVAANVQGEFEQQ